MMDKHKKFRSIKDVYVSGVSLDKERDPEPFVPLNKVYTENYKLQVTDMDGGEAVLSTEITPEKYADIKKEVERGQKILIGPPDKKQDEYTVDELLDEILAFDGWKPGSGAKADAVASYTNQILNPVKAAFFDADINIHNFGLLYNPIQYSPNNPTRNKLLRNPGRILNLHDDLANPEVAKLFNDPKDMVRVMDTIWDLKTQIATISVGRGEVCLSLFSDAKKGAKGDLEFPGLGEVEMKGAKARMGAGAYALSNTSREIARILKQRDIGINAYRTKEAKDNLIGWMDQAIINFQKSMGGMNPSTASYKKKGKQITTLQQLRVKIDRSANFDQLHHAIDTSDLPVGKYKTPLKRYLEKFREFVKEEVPHDFQLASNTFLRKEHGLTRAELVEGIAEMRNYEMDGAAVDSLKEGINEILDQYKEDTFLNEWDNRGPTRRLIAAIHTAAYHNSEGFQYIILTNDNTKNMVSITFPYDVTQVGKTLKHVYDMYDKLPLSFTTGIDQMFKSNGVLLDK